MRRFDNKGDNFYDQISALHKSVRGSNPNAALYWLARMRTVPARPLSGPAHHPHVLGRHGPCRSTCRPDRQRRGNDSRKAGQFLKANWHWHRPSYYLAVAAKSNAGYMAYNQARAFVKQDKSREVPVDLRNAPTKLMKELGYGHAYRYAHDEPNAYAAGETYFPEGMPEMQWYRPTPYGLEKKIGEKLDWLAELDRKAGKGKN